MTDSFKGNYREDFLDNLNRCFTEYMGWYLEIKCFCYSAINAFIFTSESSKGFEVSELVTNINSHFGISKIKPPFTNYYMRALKLPYTSLYSSVHGVLYIFNYNFKPGSIKRFLVQPSRNFFNDECISFLNAVQTILSSQQEAQ